MELRLLVLTHQNMLSFIGFCFKWNVLNKSDIRIYSLWDKLHHVIISAGGINSASLIYIYIYKYIVAECNRKIWYLELRLMNKQSNGTRSRYQHEAMYYLCTESQKGFTPCIRERLIDDWLIDWYTFFFYRKACLLLLVMTCPNKTNVHPVHPELRTL